MCEKKPLKNVGVEKKRKIQERKTIVLPKKKLSYLPNIRIELKINKIQHGFGLVS